MQNFEKDNYHCLITSAKYALVVNNTLELQYCFLLAPSKLYANKMLYCTARKEIINEGFSVTVTHCYNLMGMLRLILNYTL